MKFAGIEKRIADLESEANADAVPTRDKAGNRTWIRGQGYGIRFWSDILAASRDGDYPAIEELPEELAELVDLWSRAEVENRHEFGDLARANRALARHILGLEHGDHF